MAPSCGHPLNTDSGQPVLGCYIFFKFQKCCFYVYCSALSGTLKLAISRFKHWPIEVVYHIGLIKNWLHVSNMCKYGLIHNQIISKMLRIRIWNMYLFNNIKYFGDTTALFTILMCSEGYLVLTRAFIIKFIKSTFNIWTRIKGILN